MYDQSHRYSKSNMRHPIKGLYILMHSGRGEMYFKEEDLSSSEVSKLPKLNFLGNAEIVHFGCYSGCGNGLEISVAEGFYKSQNVASYGQVWSSSFTTNPDKKEKLGVVLGFSDVYLIAFDRESGKKLNMIKVPKK